MIRRKNSLVFFLSAGLLAPLLIGTPALPWDSLGHGLAAATGAKLIQDGPLKKLLLAHESLLRASSAFPDIPFRRLSTEIAGYEAEAPNHFFHLDDKKVEPVLGRLLRASCGQAMTLLGHESTRAGVSPWRAEQFEKLARTDFSSDKVVDAVYHLALGSHEIADQSVPWHALDDSHGVAAGHPNIHIFLEGCTDSFLKEGGDRYDPEFATQVEALAGKRRTDLLVFLERDLSSTVAFSIRGLQESKRVAQDFEKLDTPDVFESGKLPEPGTPREAQSAVRKGSACVKFKPLLAQRLATAAAFVSIYFDRVRNSYKGGTSVPPPAGAEEAKDYEARDYPWFECRP